MVVEVRDQPETPAQGCDVAGQRVDLQLPDVTALELAYPKLTESEAEDVRLRPSACVGASAFQVATRNLVVPSLLASYQERRIAQPASSCCGRRTLDAVDHSAPEHGASFHEQVNGLFDRLYIDGNSAQEDAIG
ncbi:hypothetical protein [Actinophytocola gossypii]|uniref:Uncharacterized protein n=1 Tax=Actinophytocola gossypii TaxID=2812003 RepID=A0ABT2JF45_9PSEU|nr:hypothetical protein [Actinophytocola gossypii]MCT2586381.1 hypothetical protein [Actinophytocola gossypii]